MLFTEKLKALNRTDDIKKIINAIIITQTGVDAEIVSVNVIAAININKNPTMPKYLAPKRSNKEPITGDNIRLTAFPGNSIKPAMTELYNNAPFKYNGNKMPVDKIHKIVINTIAAPTTNIGYLKTLKSSIGESILN